jgi:hypothetical protein
LNKFGDVRYLVNVRDGDHWTIYTDAPTKGRGIKEAKSLLSSGRFDAVKVTEDRGQMKEIIIFEEASTGRTPVVITVTPADAAPYCKELDDFYEFEARIAIGRFLRQYLDQEGITVCELIHDNINIRNVVHNDEFYIQFLQLVSNMQTKGTEEKPADRIAFLEGIVREMTDKAQFTKELAEFENVLAEGHVGYLLEKIGVDIAEENRAFSIRAVLADYLSGKADWEGKLILLLEQVEKDPGNDALTFIGELIAEILDGSEAVQEILGYQRNLAAALTTMVQLAMGPYEISEGSNSSLERLSAEMAKHELKNSQAILIDRVGRALSSVNPLTKGDRN